MLSAKTNFQENIFTSVGRQINKKLSLAIMITYLFLFPNIILGQCDTDSFLNKCAPNLGTYNYIKSFVAIADAKNATKTEFSYVFSRGSTYIIIECPENLNGGNMIVGLYNMEHKLLASTYDVKTKKYYAELNYTCSATGVYYIKPTFEGTTSGCGLCILGFNKD